jgi:hypothetical protein
VAPVAPERTCSVAAITSNRRIPDLHEDDGGLQLARGLVGLGMVPSGVTRRSRPTGAKAWAVASEPLDLVASPV